MKLCDAKGNLTPAGKKHYDREEVIVLVLVVQSGDNSSTGARLRIETTKTLAEEQQPEIGDIFRRAGATTEQRSARVVDYLKRKLDHDEEMQEASEQNQLSTKSVA